MKKTQYLATLLLVCCAIATFAVWLSLRKHVPEIHAIEDAVNMLDREPNLMERYVLARKLVSTLGSSSITRSFDGRTNMSRGEISLMLAAYMAGEDSLKDEIQEVAKVLDGTGALARQVLETKDRTAWGVVTNSKTPK